MQWQTQFNSLIGKQMTLHGQPIELIKYIEHGKEVELLTTLDDYTIPAAEAPKWLSNLLPAESRPARRTSPTVVASAQVFSDNSALQTMQQALLDSLERVQKDTSYIPQAQQVSSLVQTGINLARVELAAFQLTHKIK